MPLRRSQSLPATGRAPGHARKKRRTGSIPIRRWPGYFVPQPQPGAALDFAQLQDLQVQGLHVHGLHLQALVLVSFVMVTSWSWLLTNGGIGCVPWYGVKHDRHDHREIGPRRRSGRGNSALLPAPGTDAGAPGGRQTAYRHYDQAHLQTLRFIRRAQAAGFTLEEIKELLSLDRTRDRARIRVLAGARLEALARQAKELEESRQALQRLLGACRGSNRGPCPIIEAFSPE